MLSARQSKRQLRQGVERWPDSKRRALRLPEGLDANETSSHSIHSISEKLTDQQMDKPSALQARARWTVPRQTRSRRTSNFKAWKSSFLPASASEAGARHPTKDALHTETHSSFYLRLTQSRHTRDNNAFVAFREGIPHFKSRCCGFKTTRENVRFSVSPL